MNLRKKREEAGLKQRELAERVKIDEQMMSKIENYKCLPIPETMERLTKVLKCQLEEIYEPEEIYYPAAETKGAAKRASEKEKYYKITVRLPKAAKAVFERALPVCGYKDITYWVYRCYERLQAQYEVIQKAERKRYGIVKKAQRGAK